MIKWCKELNPTYSTQVVACIAYGGHSLFKSLLQIFWLEGRQIWPTDTCFVQIFLNKPQPTSNSIVKLLHAVAHVHITVWRQHADNVHFINWQHYHPHTYTLVQLAHKSKNNNLDYWTMFNFKCSFGVLWFHCCLQGLGEHIGRLKWKI